MYEQIATYVAHMSRLLHLWLTCVDLGGCIHEHITTSVVYLDETSEQLVCNTVHLLNFLKLVRQPQTARLEVHVSVLATWGMEAELGYQCMENINLNTCSKKMKILTSTKKKP